MKTLYDIEYRTRRIKAIRERYIPDLGSNPYNILQDLEETLGYFLDLRLAHQRWKRGSHSQLDDALFQTSSLVTPSGMRKRSNELGYNLNNIIQYLDYIEITDLYSEERLFEVVDNILEEPKNPLDDEILNNILNYTRSDFGFSRETQREQILSISQMEIDREQVESIVSGLSTDWWNTLNKLPYRLQELTDLYEDRFPESNEGFRTSGGLTIPEIVKGSIGIVLIGVGIMMTMVGVGGGLGPSIAVTGLMQIVVQGLIGYLDRRWDSIEIPNWADFDRKNIGDILSPTDSLAVYPISRNLTTLFSQEGFLIPMAHSHTLPDAIAVYSPKFGGSNSSGGVGLVGKVDGVIKANTDNDRERRKLERVKNMVDYKVGRAMLQVKHDDQFLLNSVLPTPSPINSLVETSVRDFRAAHKLDDII